MIPQRQQATGNRLTHRHHDTRSTEIVGVRRELQLTLVGFLIRVPPRDPSPEIYRCDCVIAFVWHAVQRCTSYIVTTIEDGEGTKKSEGFRRISSSISKSVRCNSAIGFLGREKSSFKPARYLFTAVNFGSHRVRLGGRSGGWNVRFSSSRQQQQQQQQ